jgi:hypothetical protein
MITAIITKLKTGSITNVIPRGGTVANPSTTYVVVWKDSPVVQAGGDGTRGTNQYYISAHFPKGFINELEDYIENEIAALLHKKILTARDGRKIQLLKTANISPIIEGNDDGTISMDRLFETVAIY